VICAIVPGWHRLWTDHDILGSWMATICTACCEQGRDQCEPSFQFCWIRRAAIPRPPRKAAPDAIATEPVSVASGGSAPASQRTRRGPIRWGYCEELRADQEIFLAELERCDPKGIYLSWTEAFHVSDYSTPYSASQNIITIAVCAGVGCYSLRVLLSA